MNNRRNSNKLLLFLGLSALAILPLSAQNQIKVDLDKPDFDDLQTPDFGGNTGKKKFKPKDWLEIEAKFKIEATNPKTPDGFVDRVTVKWYVAVKNPAAKGTYYIITKMIDHVNLPVGEDLYTSVYLSPSTVARISGGRDNASKSIVENIGIEILYKGAVVKAISSKGKQEAWWNIASPKIANTDKFVLRNKDETPFKSIWWDRYAEIKTDDQR